MRIIDGDITDIEEGIIAHQVNCQGVMGGGVALAIRNKWPVVYEDYRADCEFSSHKFALMGRADINWVSSRLGVANLYGQYFYGTEDRYTNYGALANALMNLQVKTRELIIGNSQVYFPYMMGCGLAGGDWAVVSEIIEYFFRDATLVRKQ